MNKENQKWLIIGIIIGYLAGFILSAMFG